VTTTDINVPKTIRPLSDIVDDMFERPRSVVTDDQFITFIVDGREVYYIAAADLKSKAQLVRWIQQLLPKRWATKEHVAALMSYAARVGNFDLHDVSAKGEPNNRKE
jgi:hypothetical protein